MKHLELRSNILVIEDNPDYINILNSLLIGGRKPFRLIRFASSLDDALLKMKEKKPDGVLTDIHFPRKIDGSSNPEDKHKLISSFYTGTEYPDHPPFGIQISQICRDAGIPYQMVTGHHGEEFSPDYIESLIVYLIQNRIAKIDPKIIRRDGFVRQLFWNKNKFAMNFNGDFSAGMKTYDEIARISDIESVDEVHSPHNFEFIAKSIPQRWIPSILRLVCEMLGEYKEADNINEYTDNRHALCNTLFDMVFNLGPEEDTGFHYASQIVVNNKMSLWPS